MNNEHSPKYAELVSTFVEALSTRLRAEDNGTVTVRDMSRCATARARLERVVPQGSWEYLEAVAKAFGAAGRSF